MGRLIGAMRGLAVSLGMSSLMADLATGACLSLLALSAIPAVGWGIGKLRGTVHRALAGWIGPDFAFAAMNWLTFPGVALHELSHALIAMLCGAKVDEVKLFRPAGDSLGYVRFTCRGNRNRMALQAAASSCAPVFMGFLAIRAMAALAAALPGYWQARVLAYHIAFSMACHMTMSRQDLSSYRKGCVRLFLMLLPIGFIAAYIAGRAAA